MAVKYKVDASKVKVGTIYNKVKVTSKENTKKYSEEIRDIMKEEFYKTTHKGAYGNVTPVAQGSPTSLAEHGIVVSQTNKGRYTVGAKQGPVYGSDYETILGRLVEGREYSEPYTFKLPKHREDASADGYWTVKTIEPHPYVDNTMKRLNSSEGESLFKKIFSPIRKIFGRG